MPTGDPYPAHSDRGNFAENVDWSDRGAINSQRYTWEGTPDSGQLVPVDEPILDSLDRDSTGEPLPIHPFHEEELESQRVLLINQPNPAVDGVYQVIATGQAILNAQAATVQRDIDSDFLQRVNELTRNLPPGAAGFHGMPELAVGPSEALGPPVDRRPSITSYRGRWGAAETYNRGDLVVCHDNTAWVACEQNFGIEPNSWRDMHTWDFISQDGPPRTGQWRLERVMEQIEAQQRIGEPSLFEQPKCPWCQIRGCDNPRHPENLKAIHQIAEQGGF